MFWSLRFLFSSCLVFMFQISTRVFLSFDNIQVIGIDYDGNWTNSKLKDIDEVTILLLLGQFFVLNFRKKNK